MPRAWIPPAVPHARQARRPPPAFRSDQAHPSPIGLLNYRRQITGSGPTDHLEPHGESGTVGNRMRQIPAQFAVFSA